MKNTQLIESLEDYTLFSTPHPSKRGMSVYTLRKKGAVVCTKQSTKVLTIKKLK